MDSGTSCIFIDGAAAINEIVKMIEKIPSSFWGILIGSFFTLLGIYFTNKESDKRQERQFAAERIKIKQEREISLRKEIYLSAAEAISIGLRGVANFSNLNIPDELLLAEYTQKAAAIAKVHIVAKEETLRSVQVFVNELSAAMLRLFLQRMPLMAQNAQIKVIDSSIAQFGQERDRMLELMKQHNISCSTDQQQWSVLQSNFKFESDRVDNELKMREQLFADLRQKQALMTKECLSETARLELLLVDAVNAVRKDLEIEHDENSYRSMVVSGLTQRTQALDNFISSAFSFKQPSNEVTEMPNN